jgi:hypothetical protein
VEIEVEGRDREVVVETFLFIEGDFMPKPLSLYLYPLPAVSYYDKLLYGDYSRKVAIL